MTEKPDLRPRVRGWRLVRPFFALVAGCGLIGVGVAVYTLWQDRVRQLEEQLLALLAAQEIVVADLELGVVGMDGLEIAHLRIGDEARPDLALEGARVKYSLFDLFAGGVREIEADRLVMRARYEAGALHLGALSPLLQNQGGEGESGNIPFERLHVDALEVELASPQGQIVLSTSLTASAEEGGLALSLGDDCVQFDTSRLNLGAVLADALGGQICLRDGSPPLRWPLALPGAGVSLQVKSSPVHLRSDKQALVMSLDVTEIDVDAKGPSLSEVELGLSFAAINLPGGEVGLRDVSAQIIFPELALLQGQWAVARGRLVDTAPTQRFQPVAVSGKGQMSPLRVDFDLFASDRAARPLARANGAHDLLTGEGRARVSAADLRFDPSGLQPQTLFPALVGVMTNATGGVSGDFQFNWAPGRLSSGGHLSFEQFGFSTAAARSEGIEGSVAFTSLVPPRTAKGQTLKVALVDAGFLLEDGTVLFSMHEDGSVEVEDAVWPFAGGVIRLTSGSIVPGAAGQQSLQLSVERVDLGEFLDLFRLEGISGTGIVSGLVPIIIRDGDVWIDGAVLRAADPGHLSYKSETGDAVAVGQSALLFQALEDFQYTVLEISFDGNVLDRLNVGLKLQGANPTLYDGYPFSINVTTEASFAELMRSATLGTRALDLVREFDLQRDLDPETERGAIVE